MDNSNDDEYVRVHLSLPKSDLKKFGVIAKDRRMSRSALLRECVLKVINSNWRTECQQ